MRVAFVDDHPILLEGLVSLYNEKEDLEVVGMGYSATDAIRIVEECRPDVIVVDLTMPGNVFATIEDIIQRYEHTKVVVFTASTTIQPAVELLNAGISAYVLKGSSSSELHEAIRSASRGETYLTPGFATKVVISMKTAEMRNKGQPVQLRLHHREEQIINCLLKGLTNKEIGTSISISEKTVKHYMTSLMQKLNVRNRVQLVIEVKNRAAPRSGGAGGVERSIN